MRGQIKTSKQHICPAISGLQLSCIVFIVFLSCNSVQATTLPEKNILILHSYHHGLEWTDSITEGIKSVLSGHTEYNLFFEYLDTKRNFGDAYFQQLRALHREKSLRTRFDAIIVSDNAAFNFVRESEKDVYPDVPIVFCGINNFSDELIAGRSDITGIVERADHAANIQLIRSLHPKLKKLVIINDRTLTGQNIREELNRDLKQFPDLEVDYISSYTIDELQSQIRHLDPLDAIYLLVINRDRTNKFISYRDGIGYIKQVSQAPVYGAWDFYMGKGIVGGKIISGFQHGKEAARLATELLSGATTEKRAVLDAGNRYLFDDRELKRFNIDEAKLPAGSEILFKPKPFYDAYTRELLIFFQLVVSYMVIFAFLKVRQSRMLANMVEEKTSALQEANAKLHTLSITDALTGLYNRRYFLTRLNEYGAKAERYHEVVSLFMFDIDHFKQINDEFGHPAGDAVLADIGQVLRHNLRASDIAGRYGGEEFVVIFPGIDLESASKTAHKLAEKISQLTFKELGRQITVSGGVCQLNDGDPQKILQCVDNKLYEAKNSGRNQICVERNNA